MTRHDRRTGTFVVTREHRRFVEFAHAVRRNATIGLCHGHAGVGKTLSARRYARWDLIEPAVSGWGVRAGSDEKVRAAATRARTFFYTPPVGGSVGAMRKEIQLPLERLSVRIDDPVDGPYPIRHPLSFDPVELVIVDEAERLTTAGLEFFRDRFDHSEAGLILIGMPGIEKRMSRYPQLYSRVGFVHEYPVLSKEEMQFVLARHWKRLGFEMDEADFTDTQAASAVIRLTGGNFRLLQRLLVQIERILHINEVAVVTQEVVEAAAQTLVIGNAN